LVLQPYVAWRGSQREPVIIFIREQVWHAWQPYYYCASELRCGNVTK